MTVQQDCARDSGHIKVLFREQISLRDGVRLSATVYLPDCEGRWPGILSLTPYTAQSLHDAAVYFAKRGFCFAAVDVRGRGNSEGDFWPFRHEALDGSDGVQWLAGQSYCSGKVTMWGGSYGGFVQWAAASKRPPALATIVPTASPCIGIDNPMRNNIGFPYLIQWLTMISGRTLQDKIFYDQQFWAEKFLEWHESGIAFADLDRHVGNPSEIFREWLSHAEQGEYWDNYNPGASEYAQLSIPVLTITGIYDSDQPGALEHYRRHLANASWQARTQHYLVIGPWDHAGTRMPQSSFGGISIGPEGIMDLRDLHVQWYRWQMENGPQPEFLRSRVTYYVMVEERWHRADTLEAVTAHHAELHLQSDGFASELFRSGSMLTESGKGPPDVYVYDPTDLDWPRWEVMHVAQLSCRPTFPTDQLMEQEPLYLREGKQLVYHSQPFGADTIVAGFFKLDAWVSIDQPDTDIGVTIYEVDAGGRSVLLTYDSVRARYRNSLSAAQLVEGAKPLRYIFNRFTFTARLIKPGHRLRLVVGPLSSIHYQKNHNSGKAVAFETIADARPVRVALFHDHSHPTVLHVPIGQPV